jgi:selenide,water dikinase
VKYTVPWQVNFYQWASDIWPRRSLLHGGVEISTDLVLVGGGHAHVMILKMFTMKPFPKVRITLISDVDYASYSGMVPGYLAGYYAYDELHFDLQHISQQAGVRLIRAKVIGLNPGNKTVQCADRPPLHYDLLSMNTGSKPKLTNVPGANLYATPIKPLPEFLQKLAELDARVKASPGKPLKIVLVGGGVGGVESALALKKRFSQMQESRGAKASCEIVLLHSGTKIAENLSSGARRIICEQLAIHKIPVFTSAHIKEVGESWVLAADGRKFEYTDLFWVTNASAYDWLKESGLPVTSEGFVRVNQYLQSIGEEDIFAAGDNAHMDFSPRPKAGIFPVRQARPLFENLSRKLAGQKLRAFRPQSQILTILGYGQDMAVASRGRVFLSGRLVWKWKQQIDRKFMRRFSDIGPMKNLPMRDKTKFLESDRIRCLGCGSKVSWSILRGVLNRIAGERPILSPDSGILLGVEATADAAVIQPPEGQYLVQTVDMIPTMFLDLYLSGRISALHCLSDLFAMGAKPHSVLVTCMMPYADAAITANDLHQLLSGVVAELARHGCHLIGGHTLEGKETAIGLACNGFLAAAEYAQPAKLKPSECLILTKAIGTGAVLRAHMMAQAEGRWVSSAIDSMLLSNRLASEIINKFRVKTRTDVTGFGLAGHLRSLMPELGIAVDLAMGEIPVLPGAISCLQAGMVSTAGPDNQSFLAGMEYASSLPIDIATGLLSDPQTSGGLLFGISADLATEIIGELRLAGYPDAKVIGHVRATPNEKSNLCVGDSL